MFLIDHWPYPWRATAAARITPSASRMAIGAVIELLLLCGSAACSRGVDLVGGCLDRLRRRVTMGKCEDERGVAAAHDLEHEYDTASNVRF